MYRSLREGRYDIEVARFQDAVQSLAFKKTATFPVGLLLKSMLLRSTLEAGQKTPKSIYEEFGLTTG